MVFSFLISVLICGHYYSILIGLGITSLFYLIFELITNVAQMSIKIWPGFMVAMGYFYWIIDILVFLTLHAYYYLQTNIVMTKRRYYYSASYWGNGVVDYMTDIFAFFWFNLIIYKGPT